MARGETEDPCPPNWEEQLEKLFGLGQIEDALALANTVLAKHPFYWIPWCGRCRALLKLGRTEEALLAANKMVMFTGGCFTYPLNVKAAAHFRLHQYEKALRAIDRSLDITDNSVWAYEQKCRILNRLDRLEETIETANKSIEISADSPVIWVEKSIALGATGRFEEATACAAKAIELTPEDWLPWALYIHYLEDSGKFEESLAAATKMLQFDPENIQIWRTKRDLLRKLDKPLEAARIDKHIMTLTIY